MGSCTEEVIAQCAGRIRSSRSSTPRYPPTYSACAINAARPISEPRFSPSRIFRFFEFTACPSPKRDNDAFAAKTAAQRPQSRPVAVYLGLLSVMSSGWSSLPLPDNPLVGSRPILSSRA
jgi:hypothetical protein